MLWSPASTIFVSLGILIFWTPRRIPIKLWLYYPKASLAYENTSIPPHLSLKWGPKCLQTVWSGSHNKDSIPATNFLYWLLFLSLWPNPCQKSIEERQVLFWLHSSEEFNPSRQGQHGREYEITLHPWIGSIQNWLLMWMQNKCRNKSGFHCFSILYIH